MCALEIDFVLTVSLSIAAALVAEQFITIKFSGTSPQLGR
jgi:hypothetical protein